MLPSFLPCLVEQLQSLSSFCHSVALFISCSFLPFFWFHMPWLSSFSFFSLLPSHYYFFSTLPFLLDIFLCSRRLISNVFFLHLRLLIHPFHLSSFPSSSSSIAFFSSISVSFPVLYLSLTTRFIPFPADRVPPSGVPMRRLAFGSACMWLACVSAHLECTTYFVIHLWFPKGVHDQARTRNALCLGLIPNGIWVFGDPL